jgi:hypothetical protein
MPKLTRLLFVLFLAFAPILTFSPTAQAEPLQGLGVDVYTFDSSALPDRQAYTLCASETVWTSVSNLNHDWGGDVVAGCQSDFVLIHYYGYITFDFSGDVYFQSIADDGFFMSIGEQTVIDNWWLKGCSGSVGVHQFEAGVSQRFDAWWYEYGGGACNVLYATLGDAGWGVVPDSAFSRDAVEPPIVEPPVVEPPVVEPPVVEPPIVEPPIVEPPIVEPPIVEPPIVEPPVVEPPVVEPPVVLPPVVEPEPVVIPEPSITDVDLASIDPQTLSDSDLQILTEDAYKTLETAVPGSEEYDLALEQLMVVAQADDIVVSEEIAEIPVLGATVVGLTNALNALGNFGADMSPKVREKAEQTVVAAVIVTQVATAAVGFSVSASSVRRL